MITRLAARMSSKFIGPSSRLSAKYVHRAPSAAAAHVSGPSMLQNSPLSSNAPGKAQR